MGSLAALSGPFLGSGTTDPNFAGTKTPEGKNKKQRGVGIQIDKGGKAT
jgi:hypothetical protein